MRTRPRFYPAMIVLAPVIVLSAQARADNYSTFYVSGVTQLGITFSGGFMVDTNPPIGGGGADAGMPFVTSGKIHAGPPANITYTHGTTIDPSNPNSIQCSPGANGIPPFTCEIYLLDTSGNYFIDMYVLVPVGTTAATFNGGSISPIAGYLGAASGLSYTNAKGDYLSDQIISGSVSSSPTEPGIFLNYENIAGSTESVFMGQKVVLTGSPAPDGSVAQPWTIIGNGADPNNPVGGVYLAKDTYGTTNGVGHKVDVDLTGGSVTLYWTLPNAETSDSPYEITYTPIAGGPSYYANFSVAGPTAIANSVPGVIQVTPLSWTINGVQYQLQSLTCGFPADAVKCARFNVVGPSQGGSFEWVQKVLADDETFRRRGDSTVTKTIACPGLDTKYPLEHLIAQCGVDQNGTSITACNGDSPSTLLENVKMTNFYRFYHRYFEAKMYLMWKSDTKDSILVPLGSTVWSWDGGTSYQESTKAWTQPTEMTPTIQPFVAGNDFPYWNILLRNGVNLPNPTSLKACQP